MSNQILAKDTKIIDLIDEYPFLLEELIKFDSKLKLLKNPLIRKTLGRRATLVDVSKTAGVNFTKLVTFLAECIEKNAGKNIELDGVHSTEDKKEILKNIVLGLHEGKDMEEMKNIFNETLGDVEATEIAEMEQSLIDSGDLTSEQITKLCDIHVGVFDDALVKQLSVDTVPGHPLHTYKQENEVAVSLLKKLRTDPSDELIKELKQIEIHYLRLQHQLFPVLESHGFTAPTQVMWAKQDEIRALFKKGDVNEIMLEVEEMIYKEDKILFPTAVDLLSQEDWDKVGHGEEEIGYAWITPIKPIFFDTVDTTEVVEAEVKIDSTGSIPMRTGNLTIEQINLLLTNIPVETSFIDENDRVLFYSDHSHRIFARSPGDIGRRVQNCHPQKSVATVNRILESFKDGSKDTAEFWIPFNGRLIHITYYALRDEEGNYKGVIEVTQDITDIQKLEGEQRLLSWDQNIPADQLN